MPNRIVRGALLESDRWLELAHPSERLAFVVLLLSADDLGTLDASDGQLVRLWRDSANVKGRDDALRILNALADQDLVRPYTVEGKRYVFLPRFGQRMRARSIRRPVPPESLLHDEPDVRQNIREIKAHTNGMTAERQSDDAHAPAIGRAPAPVGVGEGGVGGEGGGERSRAPSARAPTSKGTRIDVQMTLPADWAEYCRAKRSDLDPDSTFAAFKDYYLAAAGGKGVKADWTAAWRSWVRRENSSTKGTQGRRSSRTFAHVEYSPTKAPPWNK